MATISFARGVPAPECLPDHELADCARAALERDGKTILSYGPSPGYAPLREWIANRHDVDPSRVFITNGSLQGFVFLAQRLAPGKRVLVERPTYDRPLKILRELGANVVAIDQDDEGLDPEALEKEIELTATSTYITPVLLGQATVHEFVSRGLFEPNLERVRGLLGARRDAMLEALDRELPGVRVTRPDGGYFLWADLDDDVDAGELLTRAEENGVTFVKGTDFGGPPSSLRLAYSFVSVDEIAEGVSRL